MRDQLGQIIRFGVVGGINTGTFFGCYLLLHPWMPYFAAYTLAFLLSMVGSFFLNTYFTYRTRPTWKKFALFPLTNVTNYVVQSAGLYALVTWAGMDDRIAPLVAAVVAIPFTYVISRRILVTRVPAPETEVAAGAAGTVAPEGGGPAGRAGASAHDRAPRGGGPEHDGAPRRGGPGLGGPEGGMEERRPSRLA